jgi:hypothetical protein
LAVIGRAFYESSRSANLLVATTHDREEGVGSVRVVGEIAHVVNDEWCRPHVRAETLLEHAGGLSLGEVEDQIRCSTSSTTSGCVCRRSCKTA